jgi:FlaA1/EpsC-like NDP-sugar epimerase
MTKPEVLNNKVFDQRASFGKLVFLGLISIVLCSFGPLSVFAPVPLILAFLLYGRLTTLLVGGICTSVLWFVSVKFSIPLVIAGMYLTAFLYAILIAEIILRNINPVKGLIYSGIILVTIIGSSLVAFNQLGKVSIKAELKTSVVKLLGMVKDQNKDNEALKTNGEEARAFQDFISKPEELANEIYSILPSVIFVFVFFGLWISLYMALRNSVVWRYKNLYSYSLKDLINFKAPDFFVWPLILSLVGVVGADYGLPKVAEVIGSNLLYCLGVFYLFQGFGVYNAFLKYLKINGFLKTMFVVFTLVMAYKFLAILGMFDMWFDFRKFLTNKKKDEGDIL